MKEKIMKGLQIVKTIFEANRSLCIKVLAGLIVLIAIIVIASCFKGTDYGNSSGNNENDGLAVQDGKWIYYVAVEDDESVGINKVKTNGKKVQTIAEGNMYGLNVVGNYIYCIEYDEDRYQNNLIRIRKNGKGKERLARDIDGDAISVVDNWVYYCKNDNLYRVRVNGKDREKVSSREISYYQIEGKWIYYIYQNNSSEYIARMKLNGKDSERLAKADDEYYEALCVKGNKIYFTTTEYEDDYNCYLYKMKTNGKGLEKVCKIDSEVEQINMQEDKIYYVAEDDDADAYIIKSIKYKGTDKKTIYVAEDEEIEAMNVVEDWLVCLVEDDNYDMTIKMISKNGKKEIEL